MTAKEAADYLRDISFLLGTTGVEYLTQKDGEKMREAIFTLEPQELSNNSPKLDSDSGELTDGDLISRKAAIDALNECRERTERSEEFAGLKIAVGVMRALPSAQPEIVRCKDCLMHGVCRFELGLGENGFCSQAERRTDGSD